MAKKEKIAIIGTNGLPANYGGFETLTHYLTHHLKADFDFVVYCSRRGKKDRLKRFNNARLIYSPFKANGWQSVLFDATTMLHAWLMYDKLLVLGSSGALLFPLKRLFKKRLVSNMGGIESQRDKWSLVVRKFIGLSEKIGSRFSDIAVADNAHIQRLFMEIHGAKTELIEYGGDHVIIPEGIEEFVQKYPFLESEFVLSVSRAQSDNNLHMLLTAFESYEDMKLVLVSNWNVSEYGVELRGKYKDKFPNIIVLDAIYDQRELDAIRSRATLYIHSHSLCGTAPSLVEAMNLGLPIICFDVPTNRETTELKSIYFKNEKELVTVLKGLSHNDFIKLGESMNEIAKRRYTWKVIAEKYKEALKPS